MKPSQVSISSKWRGCAFAAAVAVLCFCTSSADALQEPIYVGLWTGLEWPDVNARNILLAAFNGTLAAAEAFNNAGGVNGRPLQILRCETNFSFSRFHECFDNWFVNYPSIIATVAIPGDMYLNEMIPDMIKRNILHAAPLSGDLAGRYFDEHWAFMAGESRLELLSQVSHAVKTLHLKRIAFAWSPDMSQGDHLPDLVNYLTRLGLTVTASVLVDIHGGWRTSSDFAALLNSNAQAVLHWGAENSESVSFIGSVLLSTRGKNTKLDPNLRFFCWNGAMQTCFATFKFFATAGIKPPGRFYQTSQTPTADDTRFALIRRARRELEAYSGADQIQQLYDDGFGNYALRAWMSVQFLIAFLKGSSSNLTREGLIDSVFADSTYLIDDIEYGPFTKNRSTGSRKRLGQLAEGCNNGYKRVDLYGVENNFSMTPLSTFTLDWTKCYASETFVTPPLVILMVSTPSTRAMLDDVQRGFLAFQSAYVSILDEPATFEIRSVQALSDVPAAVEAAQHDYYISLHLGGPMNPNQSTTMFQFDPMDFPANYGPTSHQGARDNVVFTEASIEQEVFMLFRALSTQGLTKEVSVVIRGDSDPQSFITFCNRSSGYFSIPIARFTIVPSTASIHAAFTNELHNGACVLFVGFQNATLDAPLVVQYLTDFPKSRLLMMFAEFMTLQDVVISTAGNDQSVTNRIIFASSLRNWMHQNYTYDQPSELLDSYFASFPQTSQRSSHVLRGFLNAAAVHKVSSLMTSPRLSSFFQATWFGVSIIPVGSNEFVGPYNRGSENWGARIVNVFSLAQVNPLYVASRDGRIVTAPLSSYVFASGPIDYSRVISVSDNTNFSVLSVILPIVLVLLAVLVAVTCYPSLLRQYTLRNAPLNPEEQPFTAVFTEIGFFEAGVAANSDAMFHAFRQHNAIVATLVEQYSGYYVRIDGEGHHVVFQRSQDAIGFAADLQRTLFHTKWSEFHSIEVAFHREHLRKLMPAESQDPLDKKDKTPRFSDISLPCDYSRSWNGLRVQIGIATGLGVVVSTPSGRLYYRGSTVQTAKALRHAAQAGQTLASMSAVVPLGTDFYGVVPMSEKICGVEVFQLDILGLERTFFALKPADSTLRGRALTAASNPLLASAVPAGGSASPREPGASGETTPPTDEMFSTLTGAQPSFYVSTVRTLICILFGRADSDHRDTLNLIADTWGCQVEDETYEVRRLPERRRQQHGRNQRKEVDVKLAVDPRVDLLARRLAPIVAYRRIMLQQVIDANLEEQVKAKMDGAEVKDSSSLPDWIT